MLTLGERRVFAPSDLLAGGTWMGVNDMGLLVAITNRFQPDGPPSSDGKLSRGLLVRQALALQDARGAAEELSATSPGSYNGFHLVMADTNSAWVVWSDGQQISSEELMAGLHVITERSFNAAPSQREDQLIDEARRLADLPGPPLSELEEALQVHREEPIESTCVHLAELNYGTRSASIISYDKAGPRSYRYAPGPPCCNAFEDVSQAMLEGLQSGDQRVAR
jgi:uncharacterized protein with NRDE domain